MTSIKKTLSVATVLATISGLTKRKSPIRFLNWLGNLRNYSSRYFYSLTKDKSQKN